MTDRITLKRLTASDLTIFESLYRKLDAGNQKAINLNADVFVSSLYPAAPQIAPTINNEFPVALSIFGPGLKSEYRVARKIIKNPSYKNWRLNGEFIHNPENDRTRFDVMQPDDVAIMAFTGDSIPVAVDLYLLARDVTEDVRLHEVLSLMLTTPKRRSMIPLEKIQLISLIEKLTVEEHPIRGLLLDTAVDAALEDAVLGGEKGIRTLLKRRVAQRLSAADLNKARLSAERIGKAGEALVNVMLRTQQNSLRITTFDWVSQDNAISPFDFKITLPSNQQIIVDAKTTEGPFNRVFHISLAELTEAVHGKNQYDLYRVYNLTEDGGKIRIAANIREFAAKILTAIEKLPTGVRPDSFSIDPAVLTWGGEDSISFPDTNDLSEE